MRHKETSFSPPCQKVVETSRGNYIFFRWNIPIDKQTVQRLFGSFQHDKNYPLAIASLLANNAEERMKQMRHEGYFITACIFGASINPENKGKFSKTVLEDEIPLFFLNFPNNEKPAIIVTFSGGHTEHPRMYHTIGYLFSFSLIPKQERRRANLFFHDDVFLTLSDLIDQTKECNLEMYGFDGSIKTISMHSHELFNPNSLVYQTLHGENPDIYESMINYLQPQSQRVLQ
ncbi:MAG: hypothetical protein N3A54_03570 [Patescibacteria group bacterium]|nr:hypothetical protein [Patescibacteria group bacterium]